MNKQILTLLIFGLILFTPSHAQDWNKNDSVWLQNILKGKDTLIVDPEVMKVIKEGSLINNPKKPIGSLKQAENSHNLLIDFSEYLKNEDATSSYQNLQLTDLPPAVTLLKSLNLKFEHLPILNFPFKMKVATGNTALVSFDAAAGLAYLFSKEYRQKVKNKKYAIAWKTYNNLPSTKILTKKKTYKKQLEENEKLPLPNIPMEDTIKVIRNDTNRIKKTPPTFSN